MRIKNVIHDKTPWVDTQTISRYPYQTICILKLILKYLKSIFSIWTLFYCILILFDKEI